MNHEFLLKKEKRKLLQTHILLYIIISLNGYIDYFSKQNFNIFKKYTYILQYYNINNYNLNIFSLPLRLFFFLNFSFSSLKLLENSKIIQKQLFFDNIILKTFQIITYQLKTWQKYPIINKEIINLQTNNFFSIENNLTRKINIYLAYIGNDPTTNLNINSPKKNYKFFEYILNLSGKSTISNKNSLIKTNLFVYIFRDFFLLQMLLCHFQKIINLETSYFKNLNILRLYNKNLDYFNSIIYLQSK